MNVGSSSDGRGSHEEIKDSHPFATVAWVVGRINEHKNEDKWSELIKVKKKKTGRKEDREVNLGY